MTEGGAEILTLEGKGLPTTRGKQSKSHSYSLLDGIPLVTTLLMDNIEQGQSGGKDAVRLQPGPHAIADDIRQLGLSDSAVSYMYTPQFRSILFQGRNLVDS
ncbi:MAG: hypothetical protein OER85_17945 [Gammaproteobacteria bacterium]|nr:hypothetical protein [Gammaproteobacteria bacterium]